MKDSNRRQFLLAAGKVSLALAASNTLMALPDAKSGTGSFDVRAFGALGDGKSNDAAPIQRAIDECGQSGGGVVVLRNGAFLTGTLMLHSHVELHLTSTAVLLGIPVLSQYHVDEKVPYRILNRSLIFAEGCEHIAITGQGVIDGQGGLWREAVESDHPRPILIRLRDCSDVRLEGVLLKDSPAFSVHSINCRQVRIEGLRIDSHVGPITDGIDVDGCQDVFISNCNIRSGDDCIALKTLEPGSTCRDIVITNCILSSDCCAFRCGCDAVGNIERVSMSNCVIRDTHLNGIKIQESMGAMMRDMVFSNIVMDNTAGAISIRLAGWKLGTAKEWLVFDDSNWERGELTNILFDNIRVGAWTNVFPKMSISITGTSRTRPRQITFSNIDITFPGGGTSEDAARRNVPDLERDYPECYMFGVLPAYGLYVHHATGLTLNNVQFHLESEDFRPAIVCDDVQDLELAGFKADGNVKAESLIRLQDAQQVFIAESRPLTRVGTFLRVEGPLSREISLSGNELELAQKTVDIAPGLRGAAVLHEK